MPCYKPLEAFRSKALGKTGKRLIQFNRNGAYSGVALRVPCGRCIGCRLERSRQWAVRCMHESQLHSNNCFLTLTYDDKHVPPHGSLVRRDLQLFLKRLRKHFGKGIRFYACGEYGETEGRPHYHLLLFNCFFEDAKFLKKAKGGQDLFTSGIVSDLWPLGFNFIGSVSFDSCAYVARYIIKKRLGNVGGEYYRQRGIIPEFTVMSRRSGIGYEWFVKYGAHAFQLDSVVMNGREVRPPRFYDGKFEMVDPSGLARIKVVRRRKALENFSENQVDRRRVREAVQLKNLANLKRDPC